MKIHFNTKWHNVTRRERMGTSKHGYAVPQNLFIYMGWQAAERMERYFLNLREKKFQGVAKVFLSKLSFLPCLPCRIPCGHIS